MQSTDARGWTLDAWVVHSEALREAEAKFQRERDLRYEERDQANKDAVTAALAAAERASEKTEVALKEYKVTSNEWRDTVKDLVANMPTLRDYKTLEDKIAGLRESQAATTGKEKGISLSWAVLMGVITLLATLYAFTRNAVPSPVPPVYYAPMAPGTLVPGPTPPNAGGR